MAFINNGEIKSVTIPLRNDGNLVATNVVVSIVLPTGYIYNSHTLVEGTFDSVAMQWSVPSIDIGESFSLVLDLEVSDHCNLEDTITWSVSATELDRDSSNDSGTGSLDYVSCCNIVGCLKGSGSFDNSVNGFTADNVQEAIEELAGVTGSNTDLTYTAFPTSGIVVSSDGTDATIPLVNATNAGLMDSAQRASLIELEANQDDLITLTGVTENDTDLGTFTGTIITDNITIKEALQELETGLSGAGGVTNLTYTASPTNGLVVSSSGTDATLPLVDNTNAGLMTPADKIKSGFITVTQAVDLDDLEANQGDLITLTGVAENSADLGTFTGTTITDNVAIKVSLQELETAIESITLDALTDTNLTGLADGHMLVWDNATSKWIPSVPSGGATTLGALTDTDIGGATNGQVLAYNNVTSKWEPINGGSGETNTATDLSTGEGVYLQKTGVDLEFKGVKANSAKLAVTSNATDILVDLGTVATSDLSDIDLTGNADGRVLTWVAANSRFEPLAVAASGEVNTASDVGTGEAIYKQKTLLDLEFKGAKANSAKISVTSDANDILIDLGTIEMSDLDDINDTGIADGQMLAWDNATSKYIPTTPSGGVTTLAAMTDTDIAAATNGQVLAYNNVTSKWEPINGGSGETNTASNVGVGGVDVFKQKTGVDLEFKSINAGSAKVTVTEDLANNEIDIDLGAVNITTLSDVDTTGVADGEVLAYDLATTTWKPITSAGGETNTASNVGTGEDLFKQKTGVDFEFKAVKANSTKLAVTSDATDVLVDLGTVKLGDLDDVDGTAATDKQGITWDNATSEWKPTTVALSNITEGALNVATASRTANFGGFEAELTNFTQIVLLTSDGSGFKISQNQLEFAGTIGTDPKMGISDAGSFLINRPLVIENIAAVGRTMFTTSPTTAVDINYILPDTQATTGNQVLTNDGAGGLSWESAGGVKFGKEPADFLVTPGTSHQWISDGTDAYNEGDLMIKINVGGVLKVVKQVDYTTA